MNQLNYTYFAADWDSDKNVVEKLREWNKSGQYGIHFNDAHTLTQARDESLNCSIKESLRLRISQSSRFVLVVGKGTKNLRAGSCHLCKRYSSYTQHCRHGYNVDTRSYIDYECDLAIHHNLKLIAIFNSSWCDSSLLPKAFQNRHDVTCIPFYVHIYTGPTIGNKSSALSALSGILGNRRPYNTSTLARYLHD